MTSPYAPPRETKRQAPFSRAVGCIVLGVFAFVLTIAAVVWGWIMVESEVSAELEAHPTIVERLGEDVTCEANFEKTGTLEDIDEFAYDCSGSLGEGTIHLHSESSGPNGQEQLVEARLIEPDGTITVLVEPE